MKIDSEKRPIIAPGVGYVFDSGEYTKIWDSCPDEKDYSVFVESDYDSEDDA